MFKSRVRRAAIALAGVAALVGGMSPAASASPETWNNCPAGRACLFSSYSGGGAVWYPLGCGVVDLHKYGVGNWARSYLTNGNPIQMANDEEPGWWFYYPAWSRDNFDQAHLAKFDWMNVDC